MALSINQEQCIGCGTCEAVCPFQFSCAREGDKAQVTQPDSMLQPRARAIREAVEMCPAHCIRFD